MRHPAKTSLTERQISRPNDPGRTWHGSYDGDAFAESLIARRPNLPVVYTVVVDLAGLSPRRHQIVLLKPLWAQELRDAVADAIAGPMVQ